MSVNILQKNVQDDLVSKSLEQAIQGPQTTSLLNIRKDPNVK